MITSATNNHLTNGNSSLSTSDSFLKSNSIDTLSSEKYSNFNYLAVRTSPTLGAQFKKSLLSFFVLVLFVLGVSLIGWGQCTHTLRLNDTFGDGWNGGAITLTVGGTNVFTGLTLVSGYDAYHTFTATVGQSIVVTRTNNGSWPNEMRIEVTTSGCNTIISFAQPNQTLSGTAACPTIPTFGNNSWNVLAYNDNDFNFTNYRGMYTENQIAFDTRTRWGVTVSPSSANNLTGNAYNGCSVDNNNHSYRYMRQGFPSGTYSLSVNQDDVYELYVNGTLVANNTNILLHSNVWTGTLNASSTIEFRVREGSGDSHGALLFNQVLVSGAGTNSISCNTNSTIVDHANVTGNYTATRNDYTTIEAIGGAVINISGSFQTEAGYDFLRIYEGSGISGTLLASYASNSWTAFNYTGAPGQTLTVRFHSDGSTHRAGFIADVVYQQSCCTPSASAPGFGNNTWNVQAYNGPATYDATASLNLTGLTYSGHYVHNTLDIDTEAMWGTGDSPSSASGYIGCPVNVDRHVFVYKRKGFPPGCYSISDIFHDDAIRIYINNVQVHNNTVCCVSTGLVWSGNLDANSEVEIRVAENQGASVLRMAFGLPLTITGPSSVCTGGTIDLNVTGETDWTTLPIGGNITTVGNDKIHTFTSGTNPFTVPLGTSVNDARVLIVGGGGGTAGDVGGGGGGGGVVEQVLTINGNVTPYQIVVGAGGLGDNPGASGALYSAGNPSSAFGIAALGGGRGGMYNNVGGNGASGGGAGGNTNNGGTGSQGNDGGSSGNNDSYKSGGGGGAGGVGGNAVNNNTAANRRGGAGGIGVYKNFFSFAGEGGYFGGGGGGGCQALGIAGTGGNGGGGNGTGRPTANVWNPGNQNGLPNTGGGAGGNANQHSGGASGGSGVVIVRYRVPKYEITGGTATTGASINSLTGVLTAGTNPGTINVTYTSATGCTVNQVVNINGNPTATISSTSSTICHGNTVTLSGTVSSGGTVIINNGVGAATTSGTTWTAVVTPTATTTYAISSVTNGGCTGTSSGSTVVTLPTAGSTLSQNGESATCIVNGSNIIHFYHSSGRLITSINPNGQNLGSVTATSYLDAGLSVPACSDPTNPNYNTATMGRHWVITPTNQPFASVLVGLPFSPTEYAAVQLASTSNSNPNDNLTGLASLKLSKYSGANEDHLFSNNCGNGTTALWAQNLSGLVNSYNPTFNGTDQYASFSITSFSEFWIHGQTSSPLPVKLTNFSATCENNVTLSWTTASEQNSDRFIVEKSRDGQTWNIVGEKPAAGNSNTILSYNFIDANSWNATSYYRLRQIDFNGAEEVYGPISVSCKGNESSMTVYPNPNNGSFTIEITSTEIYNEAQLFLTDLTGKVITSQKVNVANGTTQILMDNLDLQMGTYLVTLRGADQQLKPVKVMVTK